VLASSRPGEEPNIYLVAYSIPNLSAFLHAESVGGATGLTASDRHKLLNSCLATFEGVVDDALEFHMGIKVGGMFSVIVGGFAALKNAVDSAIFVKEQLRRQAADTIDEKIRHFPSARKLGVRLSKLGFFTPIIAIVRANGAGFHNAQQDWSKPRMCSAEFILYSILARLGCKVEGFAIASQADMDAALTTSSSSLGSRCGSVVATPMARYKKVEDAIIWISKSILAGPLRDRYDAILLDEESYNVQIIREDMKSPKEHSAAERFRTLPRDVRKTWKMFDLNQDSFLQRDEVHSVLQMLNYGMAEWEIDDFFDSIDVDGNGTINVSEFVASFNGPILGCAALRRDCKAAAKRLAERVGVDELPLLLEMWNRYDASGDGSLDVNELHSVLLDIGVEVGSVQQVEWLLKEVDEDASGVIEFSEFADLITSTRGENPTKRKIAAANRAVAPPVFAETESQRRAVWKQTVRNIFESRIIVVLFLYIVYNYARSTYRVFARNIIPDDDPAHCIADWCLDLLYLFWVIAKLLWFPLENGARVYTETSEVLRQYIRSVDMYVDIIVLLPIDIAFWADPNAWTFGFYRLNKVFGLYYLNYCYDRLTQTIMPAYAAVIRSIVYFGIAVHFYACMFIETAVYVGDSEQMNQIFNVQEILEKKDILYARSLFWATLNLAGQVEGPGIPPLDIQCILQLCTVLTGLPLYALLLATFAGVMEMKSAHSEYEEKIDAVLGSAGYLNLDPSITLGSLYYYNHVFKTMGSVELDYELPDDFPDDLKIKMNIEVGKGFLSKVPVFQTVLRDESETSAALVNELASRIHAIILEPDFILTQQGKEAEAMYFVAQGMVLGNHTESGISINDVFNRGSLFGEVELLLGMKVLYTMKNQPKKFTNVGRISREDFSEVMRYFPNALKALVTSAEERLQALEVRRARLIIKDKRELLLKNATEPYSEAVAKALVELDREELNLEGAVERSFTKRDTTLFDEALGSSFQRVSMGNRRTSSSHSFSNTEDEDKNFAADGPELTKVMSVTMDADYPVPVRLNATVAQVAESSPAKGASPLKQQAMSPTNAQLQNISGNGDVTVGDM
jgi:Ca2+-binding EF-hand superfamily protein/CRP-like cAMP-binding protein